MTENNKEFDRLKLMRTAKTQKIEKMKNKFINDTYLLK